MWGFRFMAMRRRLEMKIFEDHCWSRTHTNCAPRRDPSFHLQTQGRLVLAGRALR